MSVRWWGLAAALGAGACNAVCTAESCAAWCSEQLKEARARGFAGETEQHLSLMELHTIQDRLLGFRNGVRPASEQGFGICEGTEGCTQFVGASPAFTVAPGKYVLWADLLVPTDGTWEADFKHVCHKGYNGDGPEVVREERRVTLRAASAAAPPPAPGAPATLAGAAASFRAVLAPFEVDGKSLRFCTYELVPVGWAAPIPLKGEYRARQTMAGY